MLRHHTEVARRSPATPLGRAVLLHAIAHIEFNAINLALDAVWRFGGMHGDFPAHQGLWTMCEKTRGDIVARMALVPRTLEARGLDATPQIQHKLRSVGTPDALAAVEILDTILRDEVGHVAIGNHWYRWLCSQRGDDAEALYEVLAQRYEAPRPRPPFNTEARRRAGFSDTELAWLEQAP